MENLNLPQNFLLGAASAAHQVEGNNFNSDWWGYEQQGRLPKSGVAVDHYNRYDEDFKLAVDLGLNAMRISIEWSRIEPVEGRWDSVAIEHYRKVLKKMKELGLTRMVTLHHFTLPSWLADKGGFESSTGAGALGRFVWFVAKNLGEEVDYWITINEAEVYAEMGYHRGIWPPFKKSIPGMLRVVNNLVKAHKASYSAIKSVLPDAKIGIAKNSVYLEPYRAKFMDKLLAKIADKIGNHYFLQKIMKELDFIGINYYFYERLKFDWKRGYEEMNKNFANTQPLNPSNSPLFQGGESGFLQKKPPLNIRGGEGELYPRSDMGWRTYPEGLYYLLKDLKQYGKEIFITENGIANARDDMRKDFVRQHLESISRAISEGVDVRGYFYWSLTDTYEWHDGFGPKFGLIEIDLETQRRRIRSSAEIFKEIKLG